MASQDRGISVLLAPIRSNSSLLVGKLVYTLRRPPNTLPEPGAKTEVKECGLRTDEQLGDGVTVFEYLRLFYRRNRAIAHDLTELWPDEQGLMADELDTERCLLCGCHVPRHFLQPKLKH